MSQAGHPPMRVNDFTRAHSSNARASPPCPKRPGQGKGRLSARTAAFRRSACSQSRSPPKPQPGSNRRGTMPQPVSASTQPLSRRMPPPCVRGAPGRLRDRGHRRQPATAQSRRAPLPRERRVPGAGASGVPSTRSVRRVEPDGPELPLPAQAGVFRSRSRPRTSLVAGPRAGVGVPSTGRCRRR